MAHLGLVLSGFQPSANLELSLSPRSNSTPVVNSNSIQPSPLTSPAALKAVETDLTGVAAIIKKDVKVQDFLGNPILSASAKSAGIKDLLSSASKNPNEITQTFFEVLAENGRLYEADKVIADFLEIMSAHRGEVKVTITTAAPLEPELQKRLEKALQGSVVASEGKSLIIENKVSEAVLGGLIVDFGDKTIDLSVASKVNKLNAQISRKFKTQWESKMSQRTVRAISCCLDGVLTTSALLLRRRRRRRPQRHHESIFAPPSSRPARLLGSWFTESI